MRTRLIITAGLLALTWAVFGQTLGHEFVNYDDGYYVYYNAQVARGLSLEGLRWAFTSWYQNIWHPLATLSHMLDCELFGMNAGRHHLTNLLLHSATVALLFTFLERTTGALWRSAAVAALFAIHPLHVESVAWIAERKDMLSGFFFALTLIAHAAYVRAPSVWRYGCVALAFACGLMSKPMVITLPAVLLIIDYWPLRRIDNLRTFRRCLVEKLPLFAMSAALFFATLIQQAKVDHTFEQWSLVWRVENAFITAALYIFQMFWPANLVPFYPRVSEHFPLWQVALALLSLIAITLAVLAFRNKARHAMAGWLWYLIMFAPIAGIIQISTHIRADRYTYLPHIGLYVIVVWSIAELSREWRYRTQILSMLAIITIVPLSVAAFRQTSYWRDSETLWRRVIAVAPDNDSAHTNLAVVLRQKGNLSEALKHNQEAVRLRPEKAGAFSALGNLLNETQVEEAIAFWQKRLDANPRDVDAHNSLGVMLVQKGRIRDAVAHWKKSIEIEPNGNAFSNLAWIYSASPDPALRDAKYAVALAEDANDMAGGRLPILYRTLAAAYAEAGRFPEAIDTAKRGIALAEEQGDPTLAKELRGNLAVLQGGMPLRDQTLAEKPGAP